MNHRSCRPGLLAAALLLALVPAAHAQSEPATARIYNAAAIEAGAPFAGFIVRFREGSAEHQQPAAVARSLAGVETAVQRIRGAQAAGLRLGHVRRLGIGADVVRPNRALGRAEALETLRQLAALPGVEYVEPDLILRPALVPNDPRYPEQWGFFDADAGIRAESAWTVASGSGVTIAVLDTGRTVHSDLDSNTVPGFDFVSNITTANDGNGRDANDADPGDWTTGQCGPARNSSWHGTHVAGTAAALTNNARGVAGTAWGARIMHVRVLGTCGGSISDIADGVTWASGGAVSGVTTLAASQAARVLNLSLGGSGSCGTTMQSAINGAVGRGSTVVVAAGNSNVDASNATPANCANVVTVASVTSASSRSSFSNFGAVVDLSAPGSAILSTHNSGATVPGAESYASQSGTSMATPHVAGVVALMQSRRIAQARALMTPAEVESTLRATAYPLSGTCTGGCGAGIVHARAAVDAAGSTAAPLRQTYSNGTDVQIRDRATVESLITITGRAGNAPIDTVVAVDIRHTWIGDLLVQLVAPDGTLYTLHNRTGTSTDNIIRSYTVNLGSEAINGTWRLRVNDNAGGDTGFINSWSITL